MDRDILRPTDGSALARSAVEGGIAFARQIGARVHGFYVVPIRRPVHSTACCTGTCDCRKVRGSTPHAMILLEAARLGCDLIYMASHGWNGDQHRLLGSMTLRVLNTSRVPLLVHKSNVLISPG